MYIKKVELENIKKFKKVCVEFTSGLNFISGENGAGKTTIIESIGYALFNAPVSNKGFLPYIIRKGEKSGRIRVTFLDKDNNELISDRKVSQTSSGCSWSIRRIVDGEEDVVVSGNSEVCAYLKDHLEFYPDDDMSQVYEKILSVPQGAMTAGFFLTDTQRKSEFDPLFKLDSYRKAFDRIKLIKSLNEENIKLDNEIAEMNGKISSLDTLKEDKEKNDKLLKEKEETYKDFVVSEKKVKEDFEKIDKVKSDIEKKQNDLKLKNLELDKFKTVKEKYEKDLEDINKSVDVLKENEKEYKEYYMPKNKPEIVTVPKANYIAVRGKGDPNEEDGAYQQAISVLYAVAYTLKMSYKTDYRIEGFYDYVVPPLEGFWWQENICGCDYSNKQSFKWISMIRLPDFVAENDVEWAKNYAAAKNKDRNNFEKVEFFTVEEGLCAQILHVGSFNSEPETVKILEDFIASSGYANDINQNRRHHEIYLSDARKTPAEKQKTIIRHPIKDEK